MKAKKSKVNLNLNRTWSDIRDLSLFRKPNHSARIIEITNKPAIIEATSFIRNVSREIELVAAQNTPFNPKKVPDCSGKHT